MLLEQPAVHLPRFCGTELGVEICTITHSGVEINAITHAAERPATTC